MLSQKKESDNPIHPVWRFLLITLIEKKKKERMNEVENWQKVSVSTKLFFFGKKSFFKDNQEVTEKKLGRRVSFDRATILGFFYFWHLIHFSSLSLSLTHAHAHSHPHTHTNQCSHTTYLFFTHIKQTTILSFSLQDIHM